MALQHLAEMHMSMNLPHSSGKYQLKCETAKHRKIYAQRLARVAQWNTGGDESSVTSHDVDSIDAQQSPAETVGSHFDTLASFAVVDHNQLSAEKRGLVKRGLA